MTQALNNIHVKLLDETTKTGLNLGSFMTYVPKMSPSKQIKILKKLKINFKILDKTNKLLTKVRYFVLNLLYRMRKN